MKQVRFVPPRVALVDADGMVTREWYLFFQNFFDPGFGQDIQALALGYPQNGTLEAVTALGTIIDGQSLTPARIDAVAQFGGDLGPVSIPPLAIDDIAPVLSLLSDQIAELAKAINDMKQGAVTL